uniref:Ganglioside-induced differentiation-associated protein 1 n=1 Tax=Lygus hesperus TaxID=30085 RepID=A0A146L7G2_LYGHE
MLPVRQLLSFLTFFSTLLIMANGNSTNLILYLHNYSFYAQKVMLALNEKKLSFQSHVIDITKGKQYDTWYLEKINPRGEVPVLNDTTKLIPDSARIIDYLEDNFSNEQHPRLTPLEPIQRQKTERFREMIDKIPGNTVTMGALYHTQYVANPKLPFIGPVRSMMKSSFEKTGENLREIAQTKPDSVKEVLLKKADEFNKTYATVTNKEKFDELMAQVGMTLDAVEEQLKNGRQKPTDWLIHKDFTTADVSLTTLLYRLDIVGLSDHLFPKDGRPQVHDYFGRVQQRPAFKESFPGLFYHFKAFFGFQVLGAIVVVSVLIAGGIYFVARRR